MKLNEISSKINKIDRELLVLLQERMRLLPVIAGFLALHDPVIRIMKYKQSPGNLLTLHVTPCRDRLVDRNPEILLADRQQDRCREICCML